MSAGRVTGVVLIVTDRALELRSTLEPTAWLVLEELAISARIVDGLAVSTLSVRLLAERLGRSKDAMARALRHLAEVGLIERLEERDDFSGRFVSVHYCVDLRAAGLRLPAADEGSVDPSPQLHQDPRRNKSRSARRDHSAASIATVTGATGTDGQQHRLPSSGSPESTNLHPGAAPVRSRPDSDRRDTVGTDDRSTYRRDPDEPDTLWHDTDRR